MSYAWQREEEPFESARAEDDERWAREDRLVFAERRGRLSELSSPGGAGAVSVASRWLWEAQREGVWPVWIAPDGFPSGDDLQRVGVDLRALICVRVSSVGGRLRAAEQVLRSSCGLVVVDLLDVSEVKDALAARLMRLTQQHASACVFLSSRGAEEASLSSLVAWRAQCRWLERGPWVELSVLRDKRCGTRWEETLLLRAPSGFWLPSELSYLGEFPSESAGSLGELSVSALIGGDRDAPSCELKGGGVSQLSVLASSIK